MLQSALHHRTPACQPQIIILYRKFTKGMNSFARAAAMQRQHPSLWRPPTPLVPVVHSLIILCLTSPPPSAVPNLALPALMPLVATDYDAPVATDFQIPPLVATMTLTPLTCAGSGSPAMSQQHRQIKQQQQNTNEAKSAAGQTATDVRRRNPRIACAQPDVYTPATPLAQLRPALRTTIQLASGGRRD
jgi:hypothetical protein